MTADVRVIGGGSVFLFVLATPEARAWVDEHVSEDRQMLGRGLAVEHRYAAALAAGMQADGLTIGSEEVNR
jgi:hypothetical protein